MLRKTLLLAIAVIAAFIIGLLIGRYMFAEVKTVKEFEIRPVYPSFKVTDLAGLKNLTVVFWYSNKRATIQLCADEERLVKVELYLYSEGRKISETSFLYKVLPIGRPEEIRLNVGNETITDFVLVIRSIG